MGPSITKAFGTFEGGRLLYWPDDDGAAPLDQLRTSDALVYESKREMLLFDGKRAHAVTSFRGERYSLVFFTLQGFERAGEADREFLKGMTWPTDDILEYWRSILAPPKGLHQSGIRSKLFSVEDLPGAIQYSGTSLTKHKTVLIGVLNFLLEPLVMPALCALSRAARKECMSEGAWEGSIVDASKIRPLGYKAFTHWKLWKNAQAVVSGAWASRNVSLMVAPGFKTWCWDLRKNTP